VAQTIRGPNINRTDKVGLRSISGSEVDSGRRYDDSGSGGVERRKSEGEDGPYEPVTVLKGYRRGRFCGARGSISDARLAAEEERKAASGGERVWRFQA
jgi:hypothetical protein